MGINIDLNKGSFSLLVSEIMKDKKINDKEMLEKILLEFGEKIEDNYIILNNEYYQDGNCYYKCSEFIDRYFETEDSFDAFIKILKEINCYKEISKAEENLGIELKEKDEEE